MRYCEWDNRANWSVLDTAVGYTASLLYLIDRD